MSQLSFADVFNLARETADNSPVIQAGQQIAETVPTVHRMMSEQYSRGRFIRVFKDTGRHLGRWEVFSDFLSLAASELDMARIRTPESMEHCRKICARYEATDIANMQEMFCLMVCALEAKFHDFLGAIFMELELGDNFRGQYFTPYSVQCLMARMLMPGVRDTIRREGIATVSDPACGAAGMLIAYAECLLEADINPSMHMFGRALLNKSNFAELKDQITHPPDNTDHSVAKQKFRITNWSTYNKALINRGSLTFWLDDEAIQAWYESATPSSRGRPQRYSDLAITTVLVIKRVFRLTLRAAQGFIDSIFALMNVPLRCPDYTSVSKRAKSVNVSFKTSTRGEIAHLVIDSTGLKVFGEGEWKVRKHGKERRRIWRKLHLAVDSNTHEVVCADLSLNNVTDSEAFPGLIRQTHRKIRAAAADGAYDTRLCHDELRRKKISALIPPRKGAGYWPGEYADRNRAVANQRLSGSNARWKWTTEYNRRSIAETAMYRMKQLLGDSLTLRDYDGQVSEAMAMVRALNRMTKAGMPESVRIA
jgi:hypothetical protein